MDVCPLIVGVWAGGGPAKKGVDRLHKTFLKQILSLPNKTADPAIYILTGIIPIEGVVHKGALTEFGNVCKLQEDSIEKQLARRQLSVKGEKSQS